MRWFLMEASDAMRLTLGVWNSDEAYRDHVRAIWPELGRALDRLNTLSEHTIRNPASVTVPTVAPPVPRMAPRSHSATRSDHTGTQPSRTPIRPVQLPLDIDLGE